MFSIYKSESTKSSCRLLDLEPLKHSISEHKMAKDTYPGNCSWLTFSLLICDQLPKPAVVLNTLIRHSACGRENQGSELPFSISITLFAYCLFFSFSCFLYICLGVKSRYESATSKNADLCLSIPEASSTNIQTDIVSAMIQCLPSDLLKEYRLYFHIITSLASLLPGRVVLTGAG